MQVEFYKYQGTGNDFVMIDNRLETFPKEDRTLVAHLCNRRFGIGGDGLILLENDPESDFKMVYYVYKTTTCYRLIDEYIYHIDNNIMIVQRLYIMSYY